MRLDWDLVWKRYEELEKITPESEEILWQAIDEQVEVSEDYKLQIDDMYNDMLEAYVGEILQDDVEYDLPAESKLSLQGAIEGAVELALRLQGGFEG